MIDTSASRSIRWEVSTSLPSTLPASAARASPGPIAWATSATVTGVGKLFIEPSGRRIFGMRPSSKQNRALNAALRAFQRAELKRRPCRRIQQQLVGAIGIEPTTSSMSRMRSSQLSYAPEKCRILAECPHPHKPMEQYGQKSTAPTLRPRIVAVRHGFEDHVRAGNHVLTARDKVAHGRAARALAHRQNVLGYELV